jgi:surface antigen
MGHDRCRENTSRYCDAPAWWGGAVASRASCPVEVIRLLPTQINLKSGGCILSLALLGGITLTGAVTPVETVHASAVVLPEQSTWLAFAGPWLCRVWTGGEIGDATMSSNAGSGVTATSESTISPSPVSLVWAENKPSQVKINNAAGESEVLVSTTTMVDATFGDTTIHCTRKWHVNSLGYIISEVPNWVPDPTGAWPTTADVPNWLANNHWQVALMAHPKPKPKPKPRAVYTTTYGTPSNNTVALPTGPYSPWAPVPGHPSYGMSDFAGDPNSAFFGYCTWYAWYRHQSEPLMRLGNAATWAANAPRFGLRTGSTPAVGATAVFAPGVEGAGGAGHVAHVEAVLGGGWFIVSEMNFSWNGGGWQRVDWRFVYVTSGVTFIY